MAKNKDRITDEEVELELEALKSSKYVKLARKEQAIKYKNRQRLYILRNLDKRGRELASQGITMAMLNKRYAEADAEVKGGVD